MRMIEKTIRLVVSFATMVRIRAFSGERLPTIRSLRPAFAGGAFALLVLVWPSGPSHGIAKPGARFFDSSWIEQQGWRDDEGRPCMSERAMCYPIARKELRRYGAVWTILGFDRPFGPTNTHPSADDQFWTCMPAGEPPACLFVPQDAR